MAEGGTELDCFEGYPSNLHEQYSFELAQRPMCDDKYAPENWSCEKDARPDVDVIELKGKKNVTD